MEGPLETQKMAHALLEYSGECGVRVPGMKVPEYNEDYFRKIPEMWITKFVGFLEVIESGLLCFR